MTIAIDRAEKERKYAMMTARSEQLLVSRNTISAFGIVAAFWDRLDTG